MSAAARFQAQEKDRRLARKGEQDEKRAAAIAQAIAKCKSGDVVLVAGKGHETWQEVSGQRIPFSDVSTINAALENAA